MCDFIKDIKENYLKMEKELVTQLNYNVTNQQLTAGTYREEIWADFFRRIVPKKFNIERSVFIIDSNENISKEVDIAIYDEQYTPYIFNYGLIKFIPIEAVAAVVQCKSRSLDKDDLLNWTDSINNLQTSNDSIVRLATYINIGRENKDASIQTATNPIKILCHIPTEETSNDDTCGRDSFDIIIEAYQKSKSSEEQNQNNSEYNGNLKINFSDENLLEVLKNYNQADKKGLEDEKGDKNNKFETLKNRKIIDYTIYKGKEKYTLLSFIFQFNQMLMMINNPMFFPHKAYVDMFNKDIKEK
ncbi:MULTISPECIES: DUF6602 domain-containing protein [unclassified Parvimonas]|uniref:DUF6602 domain-containing protein n=1 Tax=unclassified Parvimonas TaxID=1151464 RepID=UPI002B47613D|nr:MULTISPECIES: DUF6602 domain-containing protein [unclassified Parvimonas]MEB3024241.1 DUF6602 domain-containing protein [Parvimonas sp. M13]MEB3073420.1 DUF6602 domain-containing protein [Parvimonas sp. C2]MEB3088387.1 DUF6602 domain-containing protein [Parvimonas sp. M20]